jgi:integrase
MNLHVLPAFKDTPIDSIKYTDIENFISNLQCGPKRINNILIPMRSVFKMAYKNGYVPENVMLKVDNMTVPLPDIFPFSYEEVVRILEVIDPFYRPYTATRFFTGMRSGEIDALLWPDHKPQCLMVLNYTSTNPMFTVLMDHQKLKLQSGM